MPSRVASRFASGTCVVFAFVLATLGGGRAGAADAQPGLGPPGSDGLPIPFRIVAGQTTVKFPPSHAPIWEASQGAVLTYEAIVISADSMDYTFAPYPGLKAGALDHARLEPGPQGPTPDRVRIDSRATQLDEVGFRGLLTPVSAQVDRLSADAAPSGMMRYQIRLDQLGDWEGMVRTADAARPGPHAATEKPAAAASAQWTPMAGWADHAILIMLVPIEHGATARRRLESAIFFGAPNGGREAEVRMLDAPPPGTEATAAESTKPAHPIPVEKCAVFSDRLALIFRADGTIDRIEGIRESRGDIGALGQLGSKRN